MLFRSEGTDPKAREFGYPRSWTDEQITAWIDARQARLDRARINRDAKRELKRQATFAANVQRFPVLAEARELGVDDHFVVDIICKAHQWEISERQAEAVANALVRIAERAAQVAEREALEAMIVKASVPVGNGLTITGEVLAVKGQDTQWGYTEKMLVRCETVDGEFKVWGTVPSSLEVERGESVTFVANVTASDDDPAFGFFSRPRKASVIAQ